MHPTAQRLLEAIRAAEGMEGSTKPSDAAACLGVSQATFTNWRSRGVSHAGLLQASARLGVSAHWLATGEGEMTDFGTNTQKNPTENTPSDVTFVNNYTSASGPRRVPVLGAAKTGANGRFEEVSFMNGAQGFVQSYSADATSYALKIKGDGEYPAIRDGWYAVVEPNKEAVPGDMVFLQLVTGENLFMELIMTRHDGITVVSLNGNQRNSYSFDELDPTKGIRRIACLAPPSAWQAE